MIRLNPVVHELWAALRFIGLRDRLRCRECKAVGTYKPHGYWSARHRHDDRPVRRWLCKCCGVYYGPEGKLQCFPDREVNAWRGPEVGVEVQSTPLEILKAEKVWPWKG